MLQEGGRPGFEVSRQYFSYETYALALPRDDGAFRLLVDRTLARLYRTRQDQRDARKNLRQGPAGRDAEGHDPDQFAAGQISNREVAQEAEARGAIRDRRHHDRRRGGRRHACSRTASTRSTRCRACRTTSCSTRCSRRQRPDAHGPHPPRAGRGLYGAGRGARDRQAAGLRRGAGAGPAQLRRRAAHRLFDERAGAGADRRDSRRRHRPRISATCTRSATRPASSSGWSIIPRCIRKPEQAPAAGRRGDASDGTGRPGPGRAAMRDRRLGQARPGDAAAAAARAPRPRSTRPRSARPRSCWARRRIR